MIGAALSGAISGALRGLGGAQGVKLTVDQDNVMQAARLVKAEAIHFRSRVDHWARELEVAPMGDDPVSGEVSRVLMLKLVESPESYVQRCYEYATMLDRLAEQLEQSALTYGFTEQQVGDMFAAATNDADERSESRGPGMGHGRRAV